MSGDANGTGPRRSAADWAPKFLAAVAATGCILRAAQLAGVRRRRVYRRRDRDPKFAKALAEALDRAMDRAEGEAYRRGVLGTARKKFTGTGAPVMDPATGQQYVEREYSDRLLALLLQAHRPRFRTVTKTEISGPDGGPIPTGAADLSHLTDDELEAIRAIHQRAAERQAAAAAVPPGGGGGGAGPAPAG